MPTFENIEIEVSQKIDIDFEVFCGTCGAGICSESDTRRSRGRGHLQVIVNACPSCMKQKDEEIKNLKDENSDLESKLYKLEQELESVRFYPYA
jgi:predicted RNase H-like nuclease (RuvC/YqgF family)